MSNNYNPLYKFADAISKVFQFIMPSYKKRRKNRKHFSHEDNLLIAYIQNQLNNDFTPQAIESHLIYHNYEKGHVHNLIHFVVSVRNNKEHVDATYSKIILLVFGLLVVLFYALAFALELSLQLLILAFSPIIFSSIFALGILSSDYIKNKETIWFIPFIFLFVYYFFSLSSNQMANFDLMPIMILNLILSLICVGLFEFLFKSKRKALFLFKDNDRAFIALQKKRKSQ